MLHRDAMSRFLTVLLLAFLALVMAPDAGHAHDAGDQTATALESSDVNTVEVDCHGGVACHYSGMIISLCLSVSPGRATPAHPLPDGLGLCGISPTRDPPVPIS